MAETNIKQQVVYKCVNLSKSGAAAAYWEEQGTEHPDINPKLVKRQYIIDRSGTLWAFWYDKSDDKIKYQYSEDGGAIFLPVDGGGQPDPFIVTTNPSGEDFTIYMDLEGNFWLITQPDSVRIFITDTEPEDPVSGDIWIDTTVS